MKNTSTVRSLSVLIPDGESNYAISVVRCLAKVKDINIIVLSNDKNAAVRFSRHTSKFIYDSDEGNNEEKLARIAYYIQKTRADILLPIDIKTIRLIAANKEKIEKFTAIAPVPNVDSFDISDDKWLLSMWLKENNIPHPETTFFNSSNTLAELISSTTFPIIIKPRVGSGGKGITIVNNADELKKWQSNHEHSGDFIIQSYITGYDIDCSVSCFEGKITAHTIQKSLRYKTDNSWPYGIEFLENEEILNVVEKVIEKFNWSGVVHIDLRYDEVEGKVKLIEMNPRFWASVSASLFAGVNFPYLSCLVGLKREIPPIKNQNRRVVRSGPALKMSLLGLFTKRNNLYYDNTFLELIITDPLPNFLSKSIEIYYDIKYMMIRYRRRISFKSNSRTATLNQS